MEEHHSENKEEFFNQISTGESKEMFYKNLLLEAKGLLEGETDSVANLANISSILYHSLNKRQNGLVNWAGFYLLKKGELVLGPFQGLPACIRIKIGRGVCGTAAASKATQLVKDVHQFPGHIACDSASNCEIVVPLISKNGDLLGVMDLDSPLLSGFDEQDQASLEELGRMTGSEWSL